MSASSLQKARAARAANRAAIKTPDHVPSGAPTIKVVAKKSTKPESDLDKMWHFQLAMDYPQEWFPVDKKTGKPHKAPFPRHFVIPNEGIAWDENYIDPNTEKLSPRARKWRFIEGQSSIWVDEQLGLESFDDKQISQMLGQTENQLIFEFGQLHVRGIEQLKLAALQVQDSFEGKERQYQPKQRTYRLLNPEKQIANEMSLMDKQFRAEQMARECTTDQIIECAFVMGIDTSDLSDAGIARIRFEFIKKSKYDEKNPGTLDWFIGILNNPLTHVRYVFATALAEGILSANQQPNRLTWKMAGIPIMEVNSTGDVADQLCQKWVSKDELTVKLLHEVENQLYEAVEAP